MLQRLALLFVVGVFALILASPAHAQAAGGDYTTVDHAIDSAGLPYVFHYIAWRESGDNPYAINEYSGACGWPQIMPYVAASYGYSCWDLMDPYIAARLTREIYYDAGLAPWGY